MEVVYHEEKRSIRDVDADLCDATSQCLQKHKLRLLGVNMNMKHI